MINNLKKAVRMPDIVVEISNLKSSFVFRILKVFIERQKLRYFTLQLSCKVYPVIIHSKMNNASPEKCLFRQSHLTHALKIFPLYCPDTAPLISPIPQVGCF